MSKIRCEAVIFPAHWSGWGQCPGFMVDGHCTAYGRQHDAANGVEVDSESRSTGPMPLEDFTDAQRAELDRIEAADPAPESLVERMAAAIYARFFDGPWDLASPLDRDGFRIEARAALDVVRPPLRRPR